ncbi:leucine-rich repeat serine/threonine-protein kinase 1-like [Lineus longissimus]|uniref:leucine-rich repeat serine/threonine-protein kinase 1-like n=1 Tax=Lineus longissimus TaxID=88925 RepID=UPI00315DB0BB
MASVQSFSLDDDPVEKKFYRPSKYNNENVLIKFLEEVDNFKYLNQPNARGFTALHLAAIHGSYECLKILLDQRADPNKKEKCSGKTPLHFAVEKENEKIVKTLLNYGADPNATDEDQVTPLDIAEKNELAEIVTLLHDQQGARNRELKALRASFSDAVQSNDIEAAREFAQQISESVAETIHSFCNGVPSLLYRSCEAGNFDMACLLLSYPGVDPCVVDPLTKWTALHAACQSRVQDEKNLVKILIEKTPVTVTMETADGQLPLHIAAEKGPPEAVSTILNYPYDDGNKESYKDRDGFKFFFPFDLNKTDQSGKTALFSACVAGCSKTVEIMINFRVNASRFEYACDYDDELEQNETGLPHNRSFYQNTQEICPFDANCCGKSPLSDIIQEHAKADQEMKKAYLAIAEMILKQGVDPNAEIIVEDLSRSPLMLAFEHSDLGMIDLLMKYGACDVGQQVLRNAAFNEHYRVISILLKYSTFPDQRNKINQVRMRADGEIGEDIHSTDSGFRTKFPTKAVSINWQGLIPNMDKIQEEWWTDACLHHNEHLRFRKDFVHFSITQIDISNNSLKELPHEIFHLPSLRFLNACRNNIEALPDHLNAYPEVLEELQIQRNEIPTLPIWLFHQSVAKLARLNASSNKICELPKEIWTAPKLTELILVNNKISELPFQSFKSCIGPSSKIASIGHANSKASGLGRRLQMQVSAEGEDEVDAVSSPLASMIQNCTESQFSSYTIWEGKIPNLQDSLEGPIGDEEFVESRLKELNLANNCFKVVPQNLPCIVPKLSKLNLSGNQIMEIGRPKDYPKSLRVLNLSGNTITGLTKNGDTDAEVEYISRNQLQAGGRTGSTRKKHGNTFSGLGAKEGNLSIPTCFHRQHHRFDSLHTLYLANNMLIELNLTFKRRKESDISIPDTGVESLPKGGAVTVPRRGSTPLPANSSQTLPSDSGKRISGEVFPQSYTDEKNEKRQLLIFPILSTLDVSNNKLHAIPDEIAEMEHLTQLILKKNDIKTLPSALGNLNKLWNFDLSGCPLEGHLQTLKAQNASTLDILGYLKSQQDKMVEYNRLKLMVVGVENIGKSMMLRNLRKHENNPSVEQKTRSQRLGQPDLRSKKDKYLPTEGVDIQELTMTKNKQKVIFKTWDFGGKREYYATHQYFLSKRALYLVVWNMEHGDNGIKGLHQWLVNIQARVPDSNVIIVGTHLDHMKTSTYPKECVQDLCNKIETQFIKISESPTHGLPRVLEHIEISNTKRFGNNIDKLADLIFKVATGLDDPSSKRPFVKQEIPHRYLDLEDVVTELALEKRKKGEGPVLTTKHYNYEVMEKMRRVKQQTFASHNELAQATQFLHENGVLLHYDDPTLQHLYFLEPQWLCDMLTCVLENEDPSTPRNGQIRIGELKHRFRNSPYKHKEVEQYIIDLMNKFELGLQYDDENLIIPQLLPTEKQLREKHPNIKEVWIPLKKPKVSPNQKRGRRPSDLNPSPAATYMPPEEPSSGAVDNRIFSTIPGLMEPGSRESRESRSSTVSYDSVSERGSVHERVGPVKENFIPEGFTRQVGRSSFHIPTPDRTPQASPKVKREPIVPTLHPGSVTVEMKPETETMKSLRRLYLMSYFPSGFWARLITRLLADQSMNQTVHDMYKPPPEIEENADLASTISRPEWLCYQTGIELVHMNTHVLLVREITEETTDLPCDYRRCQLLLQQEGQWSPINKLDQLSILEVLLPNHAIDLKVSDRTSTMDITADATRAHVSCNLKSATKLLATVISHVDNLLEDWYPDVGLRFAQNIQGMYLITRIVPCLRCFIHQTELQTQVSSDDEECWSQVFIRNGLASVVRSIKLDSEAHLVHHEFPPDISPILNETVDDAIYCFTVEECMLATQQRQMIVCEKHRQIASPTAGDSELHIAPDVVFADLDDHQLINQNNITRNKYLGRGAFSSVFKGIYKSQNRTEGVAIKVLEPIKPGNEANSGDMDNYEVNQKNWNQDPLRAACKSYLIARQECGIMFTLNHKHIVQLLGISLQPLSLILEVAPLGELYAKLKEYRKNSARLPMYAIKKIILQTASALFYLHNHDIIHRDLKSDNVMVWNMPPPHNTDPTQPVDVKLADYGISRAVLPTGGKGYAGTPGFVAPEVIQFMGEESYTKKVDCFSFGMLIYELLTLHRPLEDQLSNAANWKSIILNSDRPYLRKSDTDLYPTHFLDLMVTCWEQEPHNRPSADEIIAIASTPEFCHLRQAVSPDMCQNLRCATSIRTPNRPGLDVNIVDLDEDIPQTDVWLSSFQVRAMLEVVTYENEIPIQTKSIKLKQPSSILVMCPIGDYMWCGDDKGYIIVICQTTYRETLCVKVGGSLGVKVTSIVYFKDFDRILITLDNGRIRVCDNMPNSKADDLNIKEFYGNGKDINCAVAVNSAHHDEVWCGQAEGAVLVWDSNHLDRQPQVEHHYEAYNNDVNTLFLVTSASDQKSLWSYVYPGTFVYLWDTVERKVKRSLDCSRVIPYADRHQKQIIQHGKLLPGKTQITAMNVIDNELYVGTTWGCIIVIDKSTMHHITSFRCHEQDDIYVKAILPLTFEDSSDLDPRFGAPTQDNQIAKNIITVGKGYRNVMKTLSSATVTTIRRHSLQNRTFLLSFLAENWKYY